MGKNRNNLLQRFAMVDLDKVVGNRSVKKIDRELTDEEVDKLMERGTRLSCEILKTLMKHEKPDFIGLCSIAHGLARSTVFLLRVAERKGYDVSRVYKETMTVMDALSRTEEFDEFLTEKGL